MTFNTQLLNSEILHQEPKSDDHIFYVKTIEKLCGDLDKEEKEKTMLFRVFCISAFTNIVMAIVVVLI